MKKFQIFIFIIMCLFESSCLKEESEINCKDISNGEFLSTNPELINNLYNIRDNKIFIESDRIIISDYNYFSEGKVFNIYGDSQLSKFAAANTSCEILNLISTQSHSPIFEWEPINSELIAVAIFEEPIDTRHASIYNKEAAIWMWNSSMSDLSEISGKSRISYSEGAPVKEGEILYGSTPKALEENKVYFWVIWSWNDEGNKIKASSAAHPFKIADIRTSIEYIGSIEGCWSLKSIININSGQNIQYDMIQKFCIEGECPDYLLTLNDITEFALTDNFYLTKTYVLNIFESLLNEYGIQILYSMNYIECKNLLELKVLTSENESLFILFKRIS